MAAGWHASLPGVQADCRYKGWHLAQWSEGCPLRQTWLDQYIYVGAPGCWKSFAWIQLLLEGPRLEKERKGEVPIQKSKKRKKVAADCDQHLEAVPPWVPSKRLLLSSLSSCIQSAAAAVKSASEVSAWCKACSVVAHALEHLRLHNFWPLQGINTPLPLQRSVEVILAKLRSTASGLEASEHCRTLADLASTAASAAMSDGSVNRRYDADMSISTATLPADPSKAASSLREAIAQQQMLVQQHNLSSEPDGQRCMVFPSSLSPSHGRMTSTLRTSFTLCGAMACCIYGRTSSSVGVGYLSG